MQSIVQIMKGVRRMTGKQFEIIEVLSNLEDLEVWKWENLLEALDKIASIVGYETEQLGKEYTGSYEEDIEQLQKEYDELAEENEQLQQTCSHYEKRIMELKDEISELKGETRVIVGDLE